MARAALGICQLSYAGIVDEPLIDSAGGGARAHRRGRQRPARPPAQRARAGALLGRRRGALQRPRRGGARDGPPGRGSEGPRGGARPPPVHRRGRPRPGAPPAHRGRRDARARQAHGRPRAGAARPPLPAQRPASARRHPRRRRRPRRGRPPRHRAAPAPVALERASGAGDAGPRRRALRRGGRARRALALGTRAEEPVAAQFYATQMALLRRLRRSPEDDAELDALTGRLQELAEQYPAIPAWRSSLAATHAELGHRARRGRSSRRSPPRLRRRPAGRPVGDLGDAARRGRDLPRRRHARARLYELLLPYDGLTVIAGRAAACYGPVARVLGCSRRPRAGPTTPSATSPTPSR